MTRFRALSLLAARESRFARRRLLLFLSAISLGVAALVATEGLVGGMSAAVRDQSRALLGADLLLSSRQPFGERAEATLDSLAAEGASVARVTSFASMALAPESGGTRLVQVRAAEPGFPFYGRIETEPAGVWGELQTGRNAIVDPALLVALGAEVGDSLALGQTRFRIAGVLERLPGDVEIASAFAPRVFVPARWLEETGLIQFGSRVDYGAYLRFVDAGAADRAAEAIRDPLRPERVRVRTAGEQQRSLSDALGQLGSYLGLVGVFALLLGGIGVASAMAAYMKQKVETIAILRCLGATAPQVFTIYLLQALAMGLAGAMVGVALGLLVQWLLPQLLAGLLPVEVELGLDGVAVATGLGVGVWVAVAFALLPLLQTRRISPLGALRQRVEPLRPPRRDWLRWGGWSIVVGSVLALVVVQAGELRLGAAVAAGIAAALGVLWLLAWSVTRLLRRLPLRGLPYPLRQGLANLYRPGNQTLAVMLALGFGVLLLATLLLTQHNLLRPLRIAEAADAPNLLLWDVQEDQAPAITELLRERGLPVVQRAPIVPMRIAALNGQDVRSFWSETDAGFATDPTAEGDPAPADGEGDGVEREADQPSRWAVRREYRSTFRDTLVASEEIEAGEWWTGGGDRDAAALAPVSLEEGVAEELGVGIGDQITWDVQGVEIPTRITSLRRVDWARFEPNFFAVFPPAVLAEAPQTWVLLTRARSPSERAQVQRVVVQRFANVAILDLTLLQDALNQVIGRVSLVIRFLAGFSLATGFVVLLGAVASGRLQRIREGVLLKTLGATRRQIGAILATEYLLLGTLAALTGGALAVGAGWALARWLFEVPFGVPWGSLLVLAGATALLTAAVGVWAGREVFGRTPLEALREE